MPRLLLLMTTTTYKAEAFLAAARALGADVVVGTEREQALAPLHRQGNWTLPFADLDEAERRVRRAARDTALDAIVAADDDGALLAAHLASALGLRHNPVAAVRTARDKEATRAALQAAGLPVPRFRRLGAGEDPEAQAAAQDYPCVVKPLSLSGSRGVIRADDPTQFVAAVRRIRKILARADLGASTSLLVEDFIPGLEVALEGLLDHGRLRVLALFDKPDPLDGPFFEETLYVTPSRQPAALQTACVEAVRQAVAAIGLRYGPIHAEVRCGPAAAYLLEVAPRSIGGLCGRSLRFGSAGISLEELLLRAALGLETRGLERETQAAGVMMLPIPRAGILRRIGGVESARQVEHVEDLRLTIPPGQVVEPPPEGGRYLGFLFARAPTPAEVETALRAAQARLEVDIAPRNAEDGGVDPKVPQS